MIAYNCIQFSLQNKKMNAPPSTGKAFIVIVV
jgi:hypothetical protein